MPHALQLLSSIGIIDFNNYCSPPEVSGTNTYINTIYQVENIQDKVYVHSNINMRPNPAIKKEYPPWDIQERRLKIYFDEDKTLPDIEVDFWMKFDYSGDFALRPGKLIIRNDENFNNQEQLVMNIIDDQLLNMNLKIYAAFQQNFADFQNDRNILSLEHYLPIGKQIILVQNIWKSVKVEKGNR